MRSFCEAKNDVVACGVPSQNLGTSPDLQLIFGVLGVFANEAAMPPSKNEQTPRVMPDFRIGGTGEQNWQEMELFQAGSRCGKRQLCANFSGVCIAHLRTDRTLKNHDRKADSFISQMR